MKKYLPKVTATNQSGITNYFGTFLLLVLFLIAGKAQADNCTVNAGIERDVCANQPLILYGQQNGQFSVPIRWVQISGASVVINNPTQLSTTVSGATAGNTYEFRIYATCQDGALAYQDVKIHVTPFVKANAGPDQLNLCPGNATLAGNDPVLPNTGAWSIVGLNNAGVTFPGGNTAYNAQITLPPTSAGTTILRWTTTHSVSTCEDFDDVVISNIGGVTPVTATADPIGNCYSASTSTTLRGSFAGSFGKWIPIEGVNPVITSPTSNVTTVTNLTEGTYKFKWVVTGNPCITDGEATVSVVVPPPAGSVSSATIGEGYNIQYCDGRTSTVLTGSQNNFGLETVLWKQVTANPGVTFSNATSPSTTISGLNPSLSYTFSYTITNTSTLCSSSRNVDISYGVGPALSINASPVFANCGEQTADVAYTSSGAGSVQYSIINAPAGFVPLLPTGWTPAGSSPATVSGLNVEGTYFVRFKKESTGNGCDAAFADVVIVASAGVNIANAGTDILVSCSTYTTGLAGNNPQDASGRGVGSWSWVSGPNAPPAVQFTNIYDKNTAVTGLINGTYDFRWTIIAGTECAPTQDDVNVIVSSLVPSHADAGSDQTVCYGTPVALSGDAPLLYERGVWSVVPSTGVVFSDANDRNAIVTGLAANTAYTFTWTIENSCGSQTDLCTVTTSSTQGIGSVNAGPDQCLAPATTTVTLSGNTPGTNTGLWTKISGTGGSITTSSLYNTTVTGLSNGTYEFQWSITNVCGTITDNVIITIGTVSTADAGPDKFTCESNTTQLTGIAPGTGIGMWTQISGPNTATFSSFTANNPTLTNLIDGIYEFEWKITNGGCTSTDRVKAYISTIVLTNPDASTLGNRTLCGVNSVIMDANTIVIGTGVWSLVSGPNTPTIANSSSPTTNITNLAYGIYVFRWIAYGAPWCAMKTDDVSIKIVQNSNAGVDKSYCDLSSVNLTGNDGTSGTWTCTAKPLAAVWPTITPNPAGSNVAIASGMIAGIYTFLYSLPDDGCGATSNDVNIEIFDTTTAANILTLNSNQCNQTSFSLSADVPVVGVGTWSVYYPVGASGSFTPDANSPNATYNGAVPGTYVFRWTVANTSCSSIDEVTIKNYALPALAVNGAGPDQSLCAKQYTMAAAVPTSGFGTWSITTQPPTAPVPSIQSLILNNTLITGMGPNADGSDAIYTFRWTVSTGGGCADIWDEVTITVKEIPTTANAGPAQNNHCAEADHFDMAGNTPTLGTGKWIQVSALPGSFADDTNPTTRFNSPGQGVYVFRWTTTAVHSSCTSSDEVTITNFSMVDATGDAGVDKSICQYDVLTLTAADPSPGTGIWTNIAPFGPTTPNILTPGAQITQVTNTVPGTYYFRWTITNGACISFDDIEVIITAEPPMAIAGANQQLCNTTSTILNGNDPSPSTGKWTIESSPGGAPSFAPNDATYNATINALTVSGDYILRWTTGSGSCAKYDEMTVKVFPTLTTTDPSDATICTGGTNTLSIVASGGDPGNGKSYLWQISTAGPGGPWTNVSGSTFASYTTPALTVDTWYQCQISQCAVILSNPAKITVNPDPTVTDPVGSEICSGFTYTFPAITVSNGVSPTIQWEESDDNGVGDAWANVVGGSNATTTAYTTAALTQLKYYRVRITDLVNGCADPVSASTVVYVPRITAQPVASNTSICAGGSSNLTVVTEVGVPAIGYSYQWQYDSDPTAGTTWADVADATPAGATYTNATTAVMSVSGITATGTHDYRVVIQVTSPACAQLISNTVTVTVVADPAIPVVSDATICEGGTTTFTVVPTGGIGGYIYEWQSATGCGGPFTAIVPAATAASYTPPAATRNTPGLYYYQCVVTQAASGCSSTSNCISLTVNPDPTVTDPVGSEICSGFTYTFPAITVSNGVSPTIQWEESDDNGVGDAWANVVGGSNATTTAYTTAALTQLKYYRVRITDLVSGCADPNSASTVVYVPRITSQPVASSTSICAGGSSNLTVATEVGVPAIGYTYQWQYDSDPTAGTTWADVADATPAGATYTNATTAVMSVSGITATGAHDYRVVIQVTSPACAQLISNTVTVTVVADPAIPVVSDATICEGGTTTFTVVPTGGIGGFSYEWQSATGCGGPFTAIVPAATAASYTPPAATLTTPGSYYYQCVVTQIASGCSSTSNCISLTVNPDPTVSNPVGSTICSGSTYPFPAITVSNGVSPTIQWEESDDNGVGDPWANVVGGSNETTTAYTTAALTTSRWYRARITDLVSGCSDPVTASARVTIPTITTQPASNTASCEGVSHAMSVIVDFGAATPNYQWQFSDFDCISGWNNIVGATNANYTALAANLPPLGGTRYFRCVVSVASPACTAIASNCATVTVVGCNPRIGVSKQLVSVDDNGNGTYDALFNIRVQNYGGTRLDGIQVTENLVNGTLTSFGAGNYSVLGLSSTSFDVNTSFNGNTDINLLNNAGTHNILAVGASTDIRLRVKILSAGTYSNTVTASSTTTGTVPDVSEDGSDPDPDGDGDPTNNNVVTPINTSCVNASVNAGLDETICASCTDCLCITVLSGATASNYSSLAWTSSGTGTFNNPSALNPKYTPSAADITSGSVTLTLRANSYNTCPFQTDEMVLTFSKVTASIGSIVNPSCEGGTSGSAVVTAGGGTSPYTYLWSNGQTTATATTLTAGTHFVTVTDALGCSKKSSVLLVDPTGINATITAFTNVLCNGASTGAATVTATGGTAPYTFVWSGTVIQGSAVVNPNPVTGMVAGTYTVTVTDNKGCAAQALVNITQPTLLSQQLDIKTDVLCRGGLTGTILMDATGGTAPYSYSKDNGVTYQASNLFAGLAQGTYQIRTRDANNCITANLSVTINQPAVVLSATTTKMDALCFGAATGRATVTASGGTAPYTYLWSNGTTDQTATNLVAATYNVTVTDKNGCTANSSATINEPASALTVEAGGIQDLCTSASPITLTGASASAGATVQWTSNGTGIFTNSTSATTATYAPSAADIATGQVQLTLTATSTCGSVSDFKVLNIWPATTADAGSATAAICTGNTYTLTGTTATNYSALSWTSNAGGTFDNANALNPVFTPAAAYSGVVRLTLTATQITGSTCGNASDFIDLTVSASPAITVGAIANTTCNTSVGSVVLSTGGAIGTLTLNGNSQASPYTYTGLAAGHYTVSFVQTSTGCTATANFQITNTNSDLTGAAVVTDATCNGNTGSVVITPSGGSGTYTYSIDNGAYSLVAAATITYPALAVGSHNVKIKDGNGCTYTVAFDIDQPNALNIVLVSKTNETCMANNGTIVMDATGGTAPYTFTSVPALAFGATNTAIGISANTYAILVTDANLCTATMNVTITAPVCNPVALNDNPTTTEDVAVSGNVITSNDTDPNNPALSLTVTQFVIGGTTYGAGATATITNVGTVLINADGTYTFTPVANFNGPVPVVTYTVTNGTNTDTAELSVTVTPVNDLPIAGISTMVSQFNPGGTNSLPIPAAKFSGTDVDGTIASIKIDAMPTNATSITVNGTTYTSLTFPALGITIPTNTTGQPLQDIAIDPTNGAVTSVLSYSVIDNSGASSLVAGTVTIPFTGLSVAGTVYEDGDGLSDGLVDGTGTTQIVYVNLVNTLDKVVASVAVAGDGTYTFTEADGLAENTSYKLILTATSQSAGATLSTASFPAGFVSTGENIGAAAGSDGLINGILAVNTNSGVLANANFGILGAMTVASGGPIVICTTSSSYTLVGASATNYTNVAWTTNGTGTFTNANIVNAVYNPSAADIATGQVQLTLTAYGVGSVPTMSSQMTLTMWAPPTVNAGTNATICAVSNYTINGATATNFSSLSWTADNGTANPEGTFNVSNTLSPTYTPSAGDIAAGSVTLTLTAVKNPAVDNTCSSQTATMLLTIVPSPTLSASAIANTTCDNSVGSVTLTEGSAIAGTVSLNGDLKAAPATYTGLAAGYYTATFTATSGGCTATTNFQITNTNSDLTGAAVVTDATCNGNTGSVVITPSGGTGTYTYSIDNGAYSLIAAATITYPALAVGSHNVKIKDGNGCTYTVAFDVDQPNALNIVLVSKTNETCMGNNGTIVMDATGGTAPYTFTSPGLTFGPIYTNSAVGVSANTYAILVTDANLCTATMNVTITAPVCNPVAVDDSKTTLEDTFVSGNILTNDSDPNGLSLSVTQFVIGGVPYIVPSGGNNTVNIPGVGVLIVNSDGTYSFNPVLNYNGPVPVATYTLSNGTNTDTADLTITFTPVNDPPTINPDTKNTPEDTPVIVNVITNDTDLDGTIDPLTIDLDPVTPGIQTTYTVVGQGTFTVNSINGEVTFTPVADFNGPVTPITYRVCDNGTPLPAQCGTATISINVGVVNDPPVANDDTPTGTEDTPLVINILSNDTDLDGTLDPATIDLDPLTAGIQTTLTIINEGTYTVNTTTGVVTFIPVPNFNGTATTITYSVCDNGVPSLCDQATIKATITPVNDPPIAGTGAMPSQLNPGGTNSISVFANKFSGTDPNDPSGFISFIKIMALPTFATGITIDGITYDATNPIPVTGITVATSATGQPLFNVSIDPVDGAVTSVLSYYVIDNEGLSSVAQGSVTVPFTGLSISGTVFNDADGLTDNTVNGIGTNSLGALYMNLVNTLNQVVKSNAVAADGTYTFLEADGVMINTSYKLILTNGVQVINSTLSVATYPLGIVSTGENIGSGAGHDGTINGILSVDTNSGFLANANFGILGAMAVHAGLDAAICTPVPPTILTYPLSGSADNASSVTWTTNGTGTFDNAGLLNAVYTPSEADIATGEVQLTLTASGVGSTGSLSDMMVLTIWPAAIAYAGNDQSVCRGDVYQVLDAHATNDASILWSKNAGATGVLSGTTTLTPIYTPGVGETGIITLTLTVTPRGSGICSDVTSSKTLTITDPPIVRLGPDVNNCSLNVTTITALTALNYSSLEWSTSGTGTFTSSNTITTTYTPSVADINYAQVTLKLTARGNGSCASVSDEIVLKIWRNTYAYAGNDASVCNGQPYQVLDAEATDYVSLLWTTTGTGTLTNPTTLSPTYTPGVGETGLVTLRLTVTPEGSGTCTSYSDDKVITIGGPPVVICPVGSPFIVSNTSGKCGYVVPNTAWDATALGCIGTVTLTHNYGAWGNSNSLAGATFPVGITNVVWTAKDNYGNISTCSITINVRDTEAPYFANCISGTVFTIGLSPDACQTGAIWSIPIATDNCSSTVLVQQTSGPERGSLLSAGLYAIQYTAYDNSINTATCSFFIKVIDTERPFVVCRPDFEVKADKGLCTWTSPANSLSPLLARSNCPSIVSWIITNPNGSINSGTGDASGFTFQKGVSIVKYKNKENASAQTWDCSFSVKVVDTDAPLIQCPAPIARITDSGACVAKVSLIPPSFTDCSSSVVTTYSVIGPDNSQTEQLSASTYTFKAGISRVTWTVTDQDGNSSTCIQQVTVFSDPTLLHPNAGADGIICEGLTFVLSGSSASNYSSLKWTTSGSGKFDNPGSLHPMYTPSQADIINEQAVLTLTASTPCASSSASMTLNISRKSIVKAGNLKEASVCQGSSFTLSDATQNYAKSIKWTSSGTGTFANENSINTIYNPSAADYASGTVILTITGESGSPCGKSSDTLILHLMKQATANAGIDAAICEGSTFKIASAKADNVASILWKTSGSGTFSDPKTLNPTYSPSSADILNGSAVLILTVNSEAPCGMAQDMMELTISRKAIVSAGSSKDVFNCEGTSYTLSTASQLYTNTIKWTSSGTGTFSDATNLNAVYTPSAADYTAGSVVLTITGESSSPCGKSSDTLILHLMKQATANAGVDAAICEGSIFKIASAKADNVASILWKTSGSGTFSDPKALNPTYTPSSADILNGSAVLILTVNSEAPCVTTQDMMELTISRKAIVSAGSSKDVFNCEGTSYTLSTASQLYTNTIKWTSSGTGTFSDATNLNAVYTPSAADYTAGSVVLTITGESSSPCGKSSDALLLHLIKQATANAGADAVICEGSSFKIVSAEVGNAASILWKTSGTGSFSDPKVLNPTYSPSSADILNGSAVLTLTANSETTCGLALDVMELTISRKAIVKAGTFKDVYNCEGSLFALNSATQSNASSIEWTTSGTGIFNDPHKLNTNYNPSAEDYNDGIVFLTLNGESDSPCGKSSDILILHLSKQATANAGTDVTICEGSSYSITSSFMTNSAGILWKSSGTGTFNYPKTLHPIYFPSAADIINGKATLTITVSSNPPCEIAQDEMELTISKKPIVKAGTEKVAYICEGSLFNLSSASQTNATSIQWTSSGTGTFGDSRELNTSYKPSSADYTAGSVILTITGQSASPCGKSSDTMTLILAKQANASTGNDETVCEGSSLELASASVENASAIIWKTSGTGTFSDPKVVNPIYIPSLVDIINGSVILTLTVIPDAPCEIVQDAMKLTISSKSAVKAGIAKDIYTCAGSAFELSKASQTNATIIRWTTSGTGAFADANSLNTVYTPSATDYISGKVVLTITGESADPCGNSTDYMTLHFIKEATAEAGTDAAICEGSSYLFTTVKASNAASILWKTSGTGTFSDPKVANPTYTPSTADILNGSAILTLTVSSEAPCGAVQDEMKLTISKKSIVKAGIAIDAYTCTGSVFELSGASQTNATSIVWTTSGTGTFTDANNLNTVYKPSNADYAAGTVVLTITGQSASPCGKSDNSLTLHLIHQATANAGPDASICEGYKFVMKSASSTNATKILWKSSGTGTFSDPTLVNPIYTPSASDVMNQIVYLTMTASSDYPCQAVQDELTLSITKLPVANAGLDMKACSGDIIKLTGTSAKNYLSTLWTTNGKGTITSEKTMQPSYKPASGETGKLQFVLSAFGSNACGTLLSTDTMTVIYYEDLQADIMPADTILYGNTVMLNVSGKKGTGNYVYRWEPSNLVPNFNSNRTETLPLTENTLFTVTIADVSTGCFITENVRITIEKQIDNLLDFYNGLSPNGDGNNDTWWIDGIEKFPDNEVMIFNRWGDKVIDLVKYDNVKVFWDGTNNQGKRVPDGTYYYLVKIKNQKSYTGWIDLRSGSN